jgi:hypothetical protein
MTGTVSGTPTFMLNDVRVDADPSWTLAQWKQVIDQLLQGASHHNKSVLKHTQVCVCS